MAKLLNLLGRRRPWVLSSLSRRWRFFFFSSIKEMEFLKIVKFGMAAPSLDRFSWLSMNSIGMWVPMCIPVLPLLSPLTSMSPHCQRRRAWKEKFLVHVLRSWRHCSYSTLSRLFLLSFLSRVVSFERQCHQIFLYLLKLRSGPSKLEFWFVEACCSSSKFLLKAPTKAMTFRHHRQSRRHLVTPAHLIVDFYLYWLCSISLCQPCRWHR